MIEHAASPNRLARRQRANQRWPTNPHWPFWRVYKKVGVLEKGQAGDRALRFAKSFGEATRRGRPQFLSFRRGSTKVSPLSCKPGSVYTCLGPKCGRVFGAAIWAYKCACDRRYPVFRRTAASSLILHDQRYARNCGGHRCNSFNCVRGFIPLSRFLCLEIAILGSFV